MNFYEIFESLQNEDLAKIIKLYINNPFIDLFNSILLFNENMNESEKLIKYNEAINEHNYVYLTNDGKVKEIKLSSVVFEKESEVINFKETSYIFNKITNIEVKLNKEIDINKKDKFIKDNILYVSDIISKENRSLLIIKEYASILLKEIGNIGVLQLVYAMLDYKYDNKEIVLPKIITNESVEGKKNILNISFLIFYKIISSFSKRFLRLNDLIEIDNINNIQEIEQLNIDLSKEEILRIKNDINSGNLQDYPYYYL